MSVAQVNYQEVGEQVTIARPSEALHKLRALVAAIRVVETYGEGCGKGRGGEGRGREGKGGEGRGGGKGEEVGREGRGGEGRGGEGGEGRGGEGMVSVSEKLWQ